MIARQAGDGHAVAIWGALLFYFCSPEIPNFLVIFTSTGRSYFWALRKITFNFASRP